MARVMAREQAVAQELEREPVMELVAVKVRAIPATRY